MLKLRRVVTIWAVVAMSAVVLAAVPGGTPAVADGNESTSNSFPARSVSAGRGHTCAIVADAAVRCWGRNDVGQLGLGDTAARGNDPGEMGTNLPTVALGTGRHATALAAGGFHTCALLDNGTVKCWGENGSGQLGLGNTGDRGDAGGEMGDALPAVALGTGRTATAITAGENHTCALLDDATVKCWGANARGQLGLGDTANRGDAGGEMGDSLPAVSLGGAFPAIFLATAIAAGGDTTCALATTNLKCWGRNDRGQLGLGDEADRGDAGGEMGLSLPSVSFGFAGSATAMSVGQRHVCARLNTGSLRCWGANSFGQLGLGDGLDRGDSAGEMGDSLPAVSLGTGRTATAVTAGEFHTCVVLDDATVKCWGSNDFGEQGQGDTTIRGLSGGQMGDALPPVALGTGRSALAITAGSTHTCARLDVRTLKCWGLNDQGQLGLGDVAHRGDAGGEMGDALPTVGLATDRVRTPLAVGASERHTCAVLDDGAVRCWGFNNLGQLGLGDTADRGDQPEEMGDVSPPVDLGAARRATAIAPGSFHTCALLDDGAVKCWGANGGQLGLGDTTNRGDGPGEMGDALPPVDLGTGRTATAIAAGGAHTCALLDNGTVKCWGNNGSGQLGLGDTATRGDGPGEMGDALPPVDLGTGRTATAISIGPGASTTCALLDNGTVKCWGDNGHGQLGLGDTVDRGDGPGEMGDALPAVDLGTGRTATAVAAGLHHVCATLDTRALKCWGEGGAGQLGLGSPDDRGDAPGEMGNALPAVSLGTGRTAANVDSGRSHVCAVLDNATLKCWGRNTDGQLGLGDANNRGDGGGEMGNSLPVVSLGTGRTATAVAAGEVHNCARLDTGTLKCWGSSPNGELGLGDTTARGNDAGEMGDALPSVDLGATTGASVWGRVTDAVTGAPLGGVFAVVMDSGNFSIERGVLTAVDGTFSAPVGAGSYFVYLIDATGAHTSGFLGTPTLVTAAVNSVVDAVGVMAPTRGSISGTITETGPATPVAGAVTVTLSNGGVPQIASVADPNGAYALPPIDATSRFVGFLDPNGNHVSRFHPNSPNVPDATPLSVAAGTSVSANGSLPAQTGTPTGALLGGTVLDDVGQPLAGVLVVAMHAADFKTARADVTSANGQYTLDVTPGSYKMVFFDTTGRHDMEWHDNEPYFGIGDAANVTAPNTVGAQLDRRLGRMAGTITRQESGTGLAGAWVFAIGPTGPAGSAITAADGSYTITDLAPGTYRAAIVDPTGLRQTEYFDDASDFFTATPIAVTAGGVAAMSEALALL